MNFRVALLVLVLAFAHASSADMDLAVRPAARDCSATYFSKEFLHGDLPFRLTLTFAAQVYALECIAQASLEHGAISELGAAELGASAAKLAAELDSWKYSRAVVIISHIKNFRNFARTAGIGFVAESLVQSIVARAVHANSANAEEDELRLAAYVAADKAVGAAANVDAAADALAVAKDAGYAAKLAAGVAYKQAVATSMRYNVASDAASDAATDWRPRPPTISELGTVIDCSAFITGHYLLPLNMTVPQQIYILVCITQASRKYGSTSELGAITTGLSAHLNYYAYGRPADLLVALMKLCDYGLKAGIGPAIDGLADSIVDSARRGFWLSGLKAEEGAILRAATAACSLSKPSPSPIF